MREFWLHPPNTFSLMVEIGAAGGKIFLSIQQRFLEDTIREAFLKQLEEHDIPYRICRKAGSDIAHFSEASVTEGQQLGYWK
jgi:predicted acetyltransferase